MMRNQRFDTFYPIFIFGAVYRGKMDMAKKLAHLEDLSGQPLSRKSVIEQSDLKPSPKTADVNQLMLQFIKQRLN